MEMAHPNIDDYQALQFDCQYRSTLRYIAEYTQVLGCLQHPLTPVTSLINTAGALGAAASKSGRPSVPFRNNVVPVSSTWLQTDAKSV